MTSISREWGPSSPVSDRVWAQAVHAVVERRLPVTQAAQTFGLQQAALHRLVRQHTLQHLRPKVTRSLPGGASPSNSDDSRLTAPVTNNDRYVFPRLNSLALGPSSPNSNSSRSSSITPLPGVAAAIMSPLPPACEMTPEINDEVVAVLRGQFMQQYDDFETTDGRYGRLEGYADADITDVVRAIVGHNGRRALSPHFPSAGWLTRFKRENDFVDVDDMVRARSSSNNNNNRSSINLKKTLSSQQLQQERYKWDYELERQQYEQQHQNDQLRWGNSRNYRQQPASSPSSSQQHSPIHQSSSYSWKDVNETDTARSSMPPQRLRFYEHQHQSRDENNFCRSPSAGSSNSHPGHSDSGNDNERKYRQSNLVPAKVWEAAMEDVAIHGMSLRNAAKAHGVHFAALHRRLKKRQLHKLNTPCEPNYIPFEDEAGVVRVIHARAEMGVLLTFMELEDLLKRTALKHRSELPDDVARALVRRFQSRVEHSIRHLIIDWPSLPSNVLYRLRDVGGGNKDDDDQDGRIGGVPTAANCTKRCLPSVVSASSGSLSSSGSSSSLSPHLQSTSAFSDKRKSPMGTAPTPTWNMNSSNKRSRTSNVKAGKSTNNAENDKTSAATISPDDNEMTPAQPCMILRL